ncbi:MAG: hypothetical protein QOC81_3642 [Thermoanaerobaculia bacterium]|nr:hypothetical protein [Thermoanaerobaculia bacterium]
MAGYCGFDTLRASATLRTRRDGSNRKEAIRVAARQVNEDDGCGLNLRPLIARKSEPLLAQKPAHVLVHGVHDPRDRVEKWLAVDAGQNAAQC